MYDFHSHILPCVDHGSRSPENTERQLALLAANGVTHAVATPHFYPDEWDSVESFLIHRKKGEDAMRPLLKGAGVQVYLGAEVLLSEGLEHMEDLSRLCIEGTNILLVEMPFFRWSDRLTRTAFRIMNSGVCVMLAHVDRYPRKDVEKLFKAGAVGQVNCSAFASPFRRAAYRAWVKEGFVTAIGTDIHAAHDFREKDILRARRYLGEALTAKLDGMASTMLSPARVLGEISAP